MWCFCRSMQGYFNAYTKLNLLNISLKLCYFPQVIHFTSEDVATFIAVLGILSVIAQVRLNE